MEAAEKSPIPADVTALTRYMNVCPRASELSTKEKVIEDNDKLTVGEANNVSTIEVLWTMYSETAVDESPEPVSNGVIHEKVTVSFAVTRPCAEDGAALKASRVRAMRPIAFTYSMHKD